MPTIRWITTGAFFLAVPIFLLFSNVRIASLEARVYDYSFSHYDVEAVTGIDRPQLDRAAAEMVRYFEDDEPLLTTRVRIGGVEQALFSPRETLHMRDVKQLFQNVFFLQEVAFVYIVAYVTAVFLWARERSLRKLALQCLQAGLFTAVLMGLGAVAMLVGFDSIFREFHMLSFSNDFWELDPTRDHLVQMFPQGFWFTVSVAVGVATIIEAVTLTALGYFVLSWLSQPEPRPRAARQRRTEARAP